MSIELHIFIHDSRVPTRDAWQQAIEELGFPTVLDPTLKVKHQTGFSSAVYDGHSTGFEFDLGPAAETLSHYPQIAPIVGDRAACATFRCGGDLIEMAAALSSAAALTKLANGIYYCPNDEIVYDADEVVEAMRNDLSSL
jgi:hypothetical protein